MTLDEAITAIRTAPNRHQAQGVANSVALQCMRGERDAGDELAVRTAWWERWGNEPVEWEPTYREPRPGTHWTGD